MDTLMFGMLAFIIVLVLIVMMAKCPKMQIYSFFAFACILPSYFALELSENLPLITGARLLIILLMVYAVTHRSNRSFNKILRVQKMRGIFLIYFFCRILSECMFLSSIPSNAIKELFTIIFEQFLVVYLIVRTVNTESLFKKCLKIFVHGGTAICIVGIIQSLTGINLAYFLNTVSREMLQTNAFRLGFSRAEASFGHPVYFGEFCVLIMPIISYLYDDTKKRKYLIFLIIDLIALVLSNSRGAILPGVVILALMVIRKRKSVRWKYVGSVVVFGFGFLLISAFVPTIGDTVSSIFKSVMNIFGASFELADYGGNSAGLESRVAQISGILWVVMNGAFWFGFGPDAQMRGLVSYYFNNRWNSLETIDVGYVGFFLCEGLIGTIGQLVLIFGLIIRSYKLSDRSDPSNLNNVFFWCFLAHAFLLLSAVGLGLTYWCLIAMFIAYNNVRKTQGDVAYK